MSDQNDDKTIDEQNPDVQEPQRPETDEPKRAEQSNALSMTSGIADPPSPLLDTEDGGSEWDPANFVAPTLEEMPTEGPGSPGYDVYAPENSRWEDPFVAEQQKAHDEEDVKAALERETQDGPGDTKEEDLPESNVNPDEASPETYEDLEYAVNKTSNPDDNVEPEADAPPAEKEKA